MNEKPKKPQGISRRNNTKRSKHNLMVNRDVAEQMNKAIVKHAKEQYGIDIHAQSPVTTGKITSENAEAMLIRRDDKVLKSLYTLIESEILSIALIGIMKAKEGDISMVKYWCDKYLPPEVINKQWDKGEQGTSVTYIQQAVQVKMMMDSQGMSMDDVHKLLVQQIPQESLVETTSIESDPSINE